jgi:predicted nucleotidyltransferase
MSREAVIAALSRWIDAHPDGVLAAYLFGSVARGEERRDSDVDVGVVFTVGGLRTLEDLDRLAEMQDQLSRVVDRPVDLVPLNDAPPDLLHRVLRDRVSLFESDHGRRIEFEVQARNAYFDIAPHLHRYRRDAIDRA